MPNTTNELWRIGTRLVAETELTNWRDCGYIPRFSGSNVFFADGSEQASGITMAVDTPLYLNCAYEEMPTILEKTYTGEFAGKPFSYCLRRNFTFTEMVERGVLARLAAFYGIERPLLFAPDARRAVDICLTGGISAVDLLPWTTETSGESVIDAATLKQAGWRIDPLDGKLILNRRLILTNVHCDEKTPGFLSDAFDDDGERYMPASLELPLTKLLDPEDADPCAGNRIVVDEATRCFKVYVSREQDLRKYRLWTFSMPAPEDWQNYSAFGELPARLRTAADIVAICRRYAVGNFTAEFAMVKLPSEKLVLPPNTVIMQRYNCREDRYPPLWERYVQRSGEDPYYSETQKMLRRNRFTPLCYLKFSGDKKYLTDYAEYVLSSLEDIYPDFEWAGIKDANG